MSESMAISPVMNMATVSFAPEPGSQAEQNAPFLSWLTASVQAMAGHSGGRQIGVNPMYTPQTGMADSTASPENAVWPAATDNAPITANGDNVYRLMDESMVGEVSVPASTVPPSLRTPPCIIAQMAATPLSHEPLCENIDAVASSGATLPAKVSPRKSTPTDTEQKVDVAVNALALPPFVCLPSVTQSTTPLLPQSPVNAAAVAKSPSDSTPVDSTITRSEVSLTIFPQPDMDFVHTAKASRTVDKADQPSVEGTPGMDRAVWGIGSQAVVTPVGTFVPRGMLGMGLLLGAAMREGKSAIVDAFGQGFAPTPAITQEPKPLLDGSVSFAMTSTFQQTAPGSTPQLLSPVPAVESLSAMLIDASDSSIPTPFGLQRVEENAALPEHGQQNMSRSLITLGEMSVDGAVITAPDLSRPHPTLPTKEQAWSDDSTGSSALPGEKFSAPVVTAIPHPLHFEQTLSAGNIPVVRHVIEQIVSSIRLNAREERQEIIVRLDPPELGALRLELTRQTTGEMTAHLAATSAVSRDLLATRLPELRQALQDAGINVGQCSVSLDMQNQHGWQQPQQEMTDQQSGRPEPPSAVSQQIHLGRPIAVGVVASIDRAVDYFA